MMGFDEPYRLEGGTGMLEGFIKQRMVGPGLTILFTTSLVTGACGEDDINNAADITQPVTATVEEATGESPAGDEATANAGTETVSLPDPTSPASPVTAGPIDSALTGIEWRLVAINGDSLSEETTITLQFGEEGVFGRSACNDYSGPGAEASGGVLAIPGIGANEQACPNEVMVLETRYLEILEGVTHYHLEGEQLRLSTDDGQELLFRSVD